nr:conserved hypothetical protein [Vibrio chagasii]
MNHLLSSPSDSNISSKLTSGDKSTSPLNGAPLKNSDSQHSSFTSFFENEKEAHSSKSEIAARANRLKSSGSQSSDTQDQYLDSSKRSLFAPLKLSENEIVGPDMKKGIEFPTREQAASTNVRQSNYVGVSLPPGVGKGSMLFNAFLMASKTEMPFVPPAVTNIGVNENFLNIGVGTPIRQDDFRENIIKEICTPLNRKPTAQQVQAPLGDQSDYGNDTLPFSPSSLIRAIKESRLQPQGISGLELSRIERPDDSPLSKLGLPSDPISVAESVVDPAVVAGVDDQNLPKAVDAQQSVQSLSTPEQLASQQVTQSGEMKAQVSQVAQPRALYQVDQARLLNFIESEARVFIDSKNLTREIAVKVRPHNMGDMTITLQRNDVNQSVAVNIVTANEKATNYLNLIKGEITKQINAQISVSMMPQPNQNNRQNYTKSFKAEDLPRLQDAENNSESKITKKNSIKFV